MKLTIWCNGVFSPEATRLLKEGTRAHNFIQAGAASASVLTAGTRDPEIASADIAFGQPALEDCLENKKLRWVEVSSAGYTRYENAQFMETFRSRGAVFTNMSAVFSDSCAQHALAMILSLARQLLPSHRDQLTDRGWHYTERRYSSVLLTGQSILLLGYGAIGRRLAELLAPFGMKVYAIRRQVRSERGLTILPEEQLTAILPQMDHVVNILPENDATRNYVNARRLEAFKPGAIFYNIGRGTTVDQGALLDALTSGKLGAAYLDVTDPEPLPPEHPLWTAPNCYITPHTAGGRRDQDEAIVLHFLANLAAFERGETMTDRII
ncbi:MAG TPA: D-2-hydroxyacid dehydrogenase [Opitutaceae bacterium]|nr:D-2-hydroxyacid dehydrogenase [Opitutaceae bacterium]